ncbi:PEP-CTERM sorting domain-containing protein [Paludisphaera mucosa]|uniref:PEP-CTERM sorting domain-containing protein n=1 Tax=Paludisphaera mucosa TaxID=3030827 RepID=A0ABT6F7R4_9BACT|nr:PEP-CTERM sorting domain-containing protein [Paludisphaera mucosa]MDG3003609.1 PEP-CTERM sorting domain-containing protein [Paludisphaera mucosa]
MRFGSYPVLLIVALGLTASTASRVDAGVINGSFETGDLAGWSANDPSLATAEFSVSSLGTGGTFFPTDLDYLGYLRTGLGVDVATTLSQTFQASAGETLSFDVFFDTGDDANNDYGYARLYDGSQNLVATLFSADEATVGPQGTTGWVSVSFLIASGGSYTLEFGVANAVDNDSFFDSALGIDKVSVSAVPEPSSLVLCGASALIAAGGLLRRRLFEAANRGVESLARRP